MILPRLLVAALLACAFHVSVWCEPSNSTEKPIHTDLYGDPVPEQTIARMGTVRFRHHLIHKVAWSPDGKILASGSRYDSRIRLWEVSTGKAIRQMEEGGTAIAWSPDGKTLASGWDDDDMTIHLLDVATGKQVQQLAGHEGYIESL